MYDGGKSDRLIVLWRSANKAREGSWAAEPAEERSLTDGNPVEQTRSRTPGRTRSEQGEL
jgi:hypothetical protein